MRFILFFLLFYVQIASAQWVQLNNVPSANINCVKAFNSQFIYAGSDNALVRTLNGGISWDSIPLVDNFNTPILGSYLNSVHFTSANDGTATGMLLTGNSEVILQTFNGGINWTLVSVFNGGNWPRMLNKLFFINSSIGYAAGSNGRILKTINGGSSWSSQPSGTSERLYDIHFVSANIGFAVGDEIILRTINGGITWLVQLKPGAFLKSVYFPSTTLGYAVGDQNVLLKTTNSGATWQVMPVYIKGSFDFSGLYFTSVDTGYATAGNMILKTTDGGSHWEKHITSEHMNGVSFSGFSDGYACGQNGLIYHTTNTGTPYLPNAFFNTSPSTICHDSVVTCTNHSISSYTFSWYLNNQFVSNNYNESIIGTGPNQNDTITLVANNGFGTDTLTEIIQIQPSLISNIQASILQDTVCIGQNIQLFVLNSEIGVSYQLRNDLINIGTPQSGNGGLLNFSAGSILANDTLNLLATKTVAGCGSYPTIQYFEVFLSEVNRSLPFYASNDTVCFGKEIEIFLPLSEPGVLYQLKKSGINIGASQMGTGDTIVFNIANLIGNATFTISATNSFGCTYNLFHSETVTVEKLYTYFTLDNFNPEIGQAIYSINNSVNPLGSFLWNFDTAATPQISTAANPSGIVFNVAGKYQISLISISPFGCTDTLIKTVNVINNFQYDSCRYSQIAIDFVADLLLAIEHDYENNLIAFYSSSDASNYLTYSNHGDTISMFKPFNNNYNYVHYLTKYNPKGVPKWTLQLLHDAYNTELGDIEIDSLGNIYCAYIHREHNDSLRIYSTDNSYITINPPHGALTYSAVLIKFNKDGIYQWHNTFQTNSTTEQLSLKLDGLGNIYSNSYILFAKFNSTGQKLWEVWPVNGGFSDLDIDQNGNIWVLKRGGLLIDKYDSSGILLFTTPAINLISSNTSIVSYYMTIDENDNLYLAGSFRGSFVFAGDTIASHNPLIDDLFICKFKPNGQQDWSKHIYSRTRTQMNGFEYKNNHLILLALNEGDSIVATNLPTLIPNDLNHFIYQCDSTGGMETLVQLYDSPLPLSGPFLINHHNFSFSKINNEIALGFVFDSLLTYNNNPVFPYKQFSFNRNTFIGRGNLSCVIPSISTPSTPSSFFTSSPNPACISMPISLTDWSNNNPTGWNWSMVGSSPSTSTLQNPTVVYNTPGIYSISLVASNGNGIGTNYSSTVSVNNYPSINLTGDSVICQGQSAILVASGASNYMWGNGATTSTISVNPPLTSVYSVAGTTLVGCSDTASITVLVNPLPQLNIILPSDTICFQSAPITLSGNPIGGIFTGTGVAVNTFDPTIAGMFGHNISYTYTDLNGCIGSTMVTIYVENCTGISYNSMMDFSLFPNPANEYLIINTENLGYNLQLYDVSGNTLFEKRMNSKKEELFIGDFPAGMYYIVIHSRYNVIKYKIIIEH